MNIKYSSYSEAVLDNGWSPAQYYNQFDPIDLQLGEVYVSNKSNFMETHYKIIFVGEGIAVGKEVKGNSITCGASPDLSLFIAEGNQGGWKQNDPRPSFKLHKI